MTQCEIGVYPDRSARASVDTVHTRVGPIAGPRYAANARLQSTLERVNRPLAGLGLAVLIGAAATLLGRLVPIIGGPVFGIALGILVAAFIKPGAKLRPGLTVASRQVLQLAIVVLGFGLSLPAVLRAGAASLPVMLGTLAVALGGAFVLGRLLRVPGGVRTLVGVGTAICGASAIAAVTAVIDVSEVDVAYAMGTIFTFNIVAVLLFPVLGHLLGLSQHSFGLWAGTAVNDTSSVVAASYSYGSAAGSYGVIVKLTRSLMIIPVCIGLSVRRARRPDQRTLPWRRMIPLFLVGFLAASAIDTAGLIPTSWHAGLGDAGVFLIAVALSGIGLSLEPAKLRQAGLRPLLLGAILWALVAVSSLALQAATGTL
jgi:uncharacterized integral membrane protein (TIGR00698 family)